MPLDWSNKNAYWSCCFHKPIKVSSVQFKTQKVLPISLLWEFHSSRTLNYCVETFALYPGFTENGHTLFILKVLFIETTQFFIWTWTDPVEWALWYSDTVVLILIYDLTILSNLFLLAFCLCWLMVCSSFEKEASFASIFKSLNL